MVFGLLGALAGCEPFDVLTTYLSDLLVINKTDLAPHVGADLDVMRRDSLKMRSERPFLVVSLRQQEVVEEVIQWVREQLASHAPSS